MDQGPSTSSCQHCGYKHSQGRGCTPPPSSSTSVPEPTTPKRRRTRDSRSGGVSTETFDCNVCAKSFDSRKKLAQHRYSHTGDKPFICSNCEKGFTSKFKLVRHLLIHSDSPRYSCPICSRSFHRKDHLQTHSKTHGPPKLLACPQCHKRYSCESSYRRHMAYHSAQEGNLNCQLCRKFKAETSEEIMIHLKSHSGSRTLKTQEDKKYACPNCERRFFTKKDVRRHSVVHTGRRDYLCQYCPQSFGRRDHLVRHIRKRHPSNSSSSGGNGGSSPPPPSSSGQYRDDDSDDDDPSQIGSLGGRSTTTLPEFSSVFIKMEPPN